MSRKNPTLRGLADDLEKIAEAMKKMENAQDPIASRHVAAVKATLATLQDTVAQLSDELLAFQRHMHLARSVEDYRPFPPGTLLECGGLDALVESDDGNDMKVTVLNGSQDDWIDALSYNELAVNEMPTEHARG